MEAGILWIRPEGTGEDDDDQPAVGLPAGVPIWAIRGDADLERLGSARL
jgi:hypothetical protein